MGNLKNQTIIGYTLLEKIGEGGMAEVWYAENSIGKKAAIKVLRPELSQQEEVLRRFQNEAKIMVRLDHRTIRQVYDFGTIDGRPCIVMEYLDGADLKQRIKRGERFTDDQITSWWNSMVNALRHTHHQDIVHRDIKPSNIFITTTGELKLLDFGISKIREGISLTRVDAHMGTLLYMSPEQVRDSKNLDYRTDLYSLAVSFCHVISGKAPYDTTTHSNYDIEVKIVQEPLDMSHIPEKWQQFLKGYLAKNPEERPELVHFGVNQTDDDDSIDKTKMIFTAEPIADTPPKTKTFAKDRVSNSGNSAEPDFILRMLQYFDRKKQAWLVPAILLFFFALAGYAMTGGWDKLEHEWGDGDTRTTFGFNVIAILIALPVSVFGWKNLLNPTVNKGLRILFFIFSLAVVVLSFIMFVATLGH